MSKYDLVPGPIAHDGKSDATQALVFACIGMFGVTFCIVLCWPVGILIGICSPVAWRLASQVQQTRDLMGLRADGVSTAALRLGIAGTVLLGLWLLLLVIGVVFLGSTYVAALFSD